MKIKIFTASFPSEVENEVNKFLQDNQDISIISTAFNSTTLVDYYNNSAPPMVCNQWQEHTMTLIYK